MSRSSAAGPLLAALCVVLAVGACGGDRPNRGVRSEDRASQSAVQFVDALVRDVATASEPAGLDDAIRAREVRYTRLWLERLLPRDVMDNLVRARYRCVSGVGPGKDDAVVVSGVVGDVGIEVIDSRVLVLVITREVPTDAIAATFEQFVNYRGHRAPGLVSFRLEETDGSSFGRVGTVHVDRGRGGRWVLEPIIWASDGRRHLFIVDKAVPPPPSKVAHGLESAPESVDGVPVTDSRTYRRFADTNREELAGERFVELPENQPKPRMPDPGRGLVDRAPGGRR